MEQALPSWSYHDVDPGQQQYQPSYLSNDLPAPIYQMAQLPIATTTEDWTRNPGNPVIDPHGQDNGRKWTKRTSQACLDCRERKRKCDGGKPCDNCVKDRLHCMYTQSRPDPMLALKKEIQELHDKIDAIAFVTGASEDCNPKVHGIGVQPTIPFKRKHSGSATVIPQDEGSVLSSLTTPATQAPLLDLKINRQRCLIRHSLCPPPKSTSLHEHFHFCESSLPCWCYKGSKIIVIHAFIPGRTVIDNHSFSDVMRQHNTSTQTFMLPLLTTLYLDQIQKRFFDTERRRTLDMAVVQKYMVLWKSDHLTINSDALYFTLLANQYMIIRPRLKTLWTQQIVPSLSSNTVQTTLLHHGDLGLRLKINSHWIFSNIAFRLCPGQPSSFLSNDEESLDEIDPLVGLSPKLLNIYAGVTWQLLRSQLRTTQETTLFEGLTRVRQRLPHLEGLSGREGKILEDCASAYLHGAYIYVLCRLEGRPASDPIVQQHRNELYQLLDPGVLPLSGGLYWAVWPLVPAFILCVTCVDKEERHTLREGLIQDLHESGSYSNIPPALDAISIVWLNREVDMLKEGWWEDMVAIIGPERISLT